MSIHIEDYDMVFVTNPHDNHSDHTACYTYIINYVQKIKNKKIRVYIYEVHTPMADVDYYLDISEVIDKKKELISCYKSQMEIHNYSGQIEKLAEYRGYQNGNSGQLLEVYKEVTQLDGSTIYSGIEKELAKYKAFTRILGEWVKCSDNSILVSFWRKEVIMKLLSMGLEYWEKHCIII